VAGNLDKAEHRKFRKRLDDLSRAWARHMGTSVKYGQKTEAAFARRLRRWKACKEHIENVFAAIDEQGLPTPPSLQLTIQRLEALLSASRIFRLG
jgi:hypothetical protein